ncbi:hypothetical protein QVD17_28782 [Tagetes erecta]|uniref:Uncharacterized protein n=1 Tax=Tagetes erecta TaxID=13708 RepID=A0AAD8NT30_TARER|nr:hypothetical protein QVD17_28782 [Tagetes erecta]
MEPILEGAQRFKKKLFIEKYKEKQEIEKNTGKEAKKKTGNKTRIRCRLDLFREVLKTTLEDQHKKDVILKTPFGKLNDQQKALIINENENIRW